MRSNTGCHLPETDRQVLCRQDGTPVVGVHPTNLSTDPYQQVVELGTGQPQEALETVIIRVYFLEKAVKLSCTKSVVEVLHRLGNLTTSE